MDFLLLNSSFHTKRGDRIQTVAPHLRIGVASIAAYLKGNGADVEVLDPEVCGLSIDELTPEIVSRNPRFLCLPAYTEEIRDAAGLAEKVKAAAPQITTLVGGYHVSALPRQTLEEFPSFDLGVVGEGERVLGDLHEGAAAEKVAGVVWRDGSGKIAVNEPRNGLAPLDEIPFPAWDFYDLKAYEGGLPIEPLRACPFGCTFCFRALGRKVSYKSPKRVVDEIARSVERYGVRSFRFLAGTFPLKRDHAVEIFEEIVARRLDVTWTASCRVDVLDEDLLRLMKQSGCTVLQLGIESGDPEILRISSKGISPEKCVETARLCRKVGIKVGLNFILGLPHETRSTVFSTFRLALKMRRYADSANFAILVPFPGTETYEMALRNEGGIGLRTSDWSDFGKQAGAALRHDNFSDGALQRYQSLFYLLYYLSVPSKALRLFSVDRATLVFKRLFGLGRK